jgi:hypothetical protein
MTSVFISYSRKDKIKVNGIAEILKAAGLDIWIDTSDIPPAEYWRDEIVTAIKNHDNFLIFISPTSVQSENVKRELILASNEKRRILPVILSHTELPESFRYILEGSGIQYIDLTSEFDNGIVKIVNALGAERPPKNYTKYLLSYLPGLITPELIAPYSKTSNEVVIGKTITIQQIRDQRFFLRKQRLDEALSNLDILVKEKQGATEPVIYTYWLDGRSGCGKSVLLLQLMQEIVVKRGALAFWLDDASENLQTFLESWAENYVDIEDVVYVFIDDFNAPRTRDIIDYAPIARLLRDPNFDHVKWPILVTCSPPEYLDEFQTSGSDEGFWVRRWPIPPITKDEQSNLLDWFQRRTGEIPKTGAAFEQAEGLVLSMMFELRYGDMKEFGRRFAERLEGSGLLEVMAQPLALNRLYIWPPKRWLDEFSPEQKEALVTLNADHDFSILAIENQKDEFARLTHPHLSDVIYKAIRPQSAGILRASDLAIAFERALLVNDILASRVLRAIADGGDRIIVDLDSETLAKEVVAIWVKHAEVVKRIHPISLAFFWTYWSTWASRDEKVRNNIGTISPFAEAIRALGKEHHAWGILWQKLWDCQPGSDLLTRSAISWLEIKNHFIIPQWAFVWRTLLQHPDQLPDGTSLNSLIQLGTQWLTGREDKDQWSFVWENLYNHLSQLPIPLDHFISIGVNWLKLHYDREDWNYIWRDILLIGSNETSRELFFHGSVWLVGREEKDQWAFVWQTLLQHPDQLPDGTSLNSLIQLGTQWLTGREDKDQWKFVWEVLLQHPDQLPDGTSLNSLIQLGTQWLTGREDKDQWVFVWQTLLQHPDQLPDGTSLNSLIQLGTQWLTGREDNPGWSHVWQTLFKQFNRITVNTTRECIFQAGISWLKDHEDHADWAFIWEDLIKSKSDKVIQKELINWGKNWLPSREQYDSWSFIFEHCLRHGSIDKSFLDMGVRWILKNQKRPETLGIVAQIAEYHDCLSPDIKISLTKYIRNSVYESNPDQNQWSFGWAAYWKLMPSLETVDIALKWIEAFPHRKTSAEWIVNFLFETKRHDVDLRIKNWYSNHRHIPIAETIQNRLIKLGFTDM